MKKLRKLLPLLFVFLLLCGFNSEETKVYDDADLLTDAQESALQSRCISIAQDKEVDIIIVTINDNNGKSSMAYADDFYDENGFGYDHSQGTGILLLLDMDAREAYISTCGQAITYFTDSRIDRMLDDIVIELGDQDYNGACNEFLQDVENYMGVDPSRDGMGIKIAVSIVIACLISGVIVALMVSSSKSKMTATGNTYIETGSIKDFGSYDKFTHTTTTVVKKPDDNDGGSSTHSSSGGVTHGGGGRSF